MVAFNNLKFSDLFIIPISFYIDQGDVFGWGNSEYGQFKMITDEMQLHTPRHLKLPSTCGKIVDVAASATSCLALNGKGFFFHENSKNIFGF